MLQDSHPDDARISAQWRLGRGDAAQKIEHLGLMFSALAASPKSYGVPLCQLTAERSARAVSVDPLGAISFNLRETYSELPVAPSQTAKHATKDYPTV